MSKTVNNNDVMVKITKLEVDVSYIKNNIDEIKALLGSLPNTYATKSELEEVKTNLNDHRKTERGWVQAAIPWGFAAINLCVTLYLLFR